LWCNEFKNADTKYILKRVFEDENVADTIRIKAKVIFSVNLFVKFLE